MTFGIGFSLQRALALPGLDHVNVLTAGTDQAHSFCADFRLTEAQATSALHEARTITKGNYLDRFDWLPCFVRGTARASGKTVEWEFRAGGNGTLTYADGHRVFLGCDGCRKRFGRSAP